MVRPFETRVAAFSDHLIFPCLGVTGEDTRIAAQPSRNPKSSATQRNRGSRGLGRDRRNAVRDAEQGQKQKATHEEMPEGCEERAKKIVAAEPEVGNAER